MSVVFCWQHLVRIGQVQCRDSGCFLLFPAAGRVDAVTFATGTGGTLAGASFPPSVDHR